MKDSRKIKEEFGISEEEAVLEYQEITEILKITYILLAEEIFLLARSKIRILDLGTGLGNLARELAKRYPEAEIFGLDISSEILKEAMRIKENPLNLKFLLMDVHNLDFSDNSIDLISSYGSLHHWK
ncbi:MAG: class I SAM-dependent methyltransferase, partial [Candidatus Omnitrophica bacterium]|nr:class I SAM-dependent methyltransferase [Candidatus Omnitrophota bacterium]